MRAAPRSMVAKWLPPVLLCAVAFVQIALVRNAALTPWKGGGFGMFSTLDHGAYRGVDIIVDGPGRSETLEIPPSLETAEARAANCPADWLLQALAEGVVARERRYGRTVSSVTLIAWRTEFEPQTLRANYRPIRRDPYVYTVR